MADQPQNIMDQIKLLLGFGQPPVDPNAGLSDFERLRRGLNPVEPVNPGVQDLLITPPPAVGGAAPPDVLRALGTLGQR